MARWKLHRDIHLKIYPYLFCIPCQTANFFLKRDTTEHTSLCIRYWSMAQTVGMCVVISWLKSSRELQARAHISRVLPVCGGEWRKQKWEKRKEVGNHETWKLGSNCLFIVWNCCNGYTNDPLTDRRVAYHNAFDKLLMWLFIIHNDDHSASSYFSIRCLM